MAPAEHPFLPVELPPAAKHFLTHSWLPKNLTVAGQHVAGKPVESAAPGAIQPVDSAAPGAVPAEAITTGATAAINQSVAAIHAAAKATGATAAIKQSGKAFQAVAKTTGTAAAIKQSGKAIQAVAKATGATAAIKQSGAAIQAAAITTGATAVIKETGMLLTEAQAVIVEHAAVICCLFFFLSPILAVQSVVRTKGESLHLVNPVSLLAMFMNCSTNLIYGLFLPLPAAVPANVVGLIISCYALGSLWFYAWPSVAQPSAWGKEAALATAASVLMSFTCLIFAAGTATGATTVGNFAMAMGIVMYGAPLSAAWEVLRDRNSEKLPLLQCGLGFVNSSLWCIVGINRQSPPIAVPNVAGMLMCAVQLLLIFWFPASSPKIVMPDCYSTHKRDSEKDPLCFITEPHVFPASDTKSDFADSVSTHKPDDGKDPLFFKTDPLVVVFAAEALPEARSGMTSV